MWELPVLQSALGSGDDTVLYLWEKQMQPLIHSL